MDYYEISLFCVANVKIGVSMNLFKLIFSIQLLSELTYIIIILNHF